MDAAFSSLFYFLVLCACACSSEVTITTISHPSFVSHRGFFFTNHRPPPPSPLSLCLAVASSSSPPEGFPLAYRAQLSRVGGSRWGWVLRMKFRAIALNHCSLLIAPSRLPRSLPLRPLMKGFRSLTEPTLVALATPDGVGFSK